MSSPRPERRQPTEEMSRPLIVLRGITKDYRTPAGSIAALRGVDLEIDRGEFVILFGRSGAGKSTLINIVTGVDRPDAGSLLVDGEEVHQMGERQITRWRGRQVGVILQSFHLMPTLTGIQNVMLPMDFAGRMRATQAQRSEALRLLGLVGLADQADKLPSAMSGGQQQRVAIARALANDPIFLAADEPTGSLDSATADTVFRIFERLVEEGRTIILATHDRELAARGGRVVLIEDGRITGEHPASSPV